MQTKSCTMCGVEKPLDEFHHHPTGKHQRQPRCKACHNAASQLRYQERSAEERSRQIARQKALKYGFESAEALYAFAEDHGELCDLCGKPDTTHRKRTWTRGLTMDHDPATGRFRGMLCSLCNLAIGNAHDDADLLRRMADYVERFR